MELAARSESTWSDETAWVGTRRPISEAYALPAACYVDDTFFADEQRLVFGTSWVVVGVTSELTAPGSLLVREVAGQSVIITRNADGDLRAFHNACRHRGTQLAEADCEISNIIRCPYHRWGYNLDGTLVATPRFADAGVDDFDPADYGLKPVRVGTVACLISICFDDTTPPLDEWVGDLAERLAAYGLAEWVERDRTEVEISANWKLISENFQEYYHLNYVHPELAKVSRVEDHYRYQGPGQYCGQTTTPLTSDERGDWTAMPAKPGLDDSDGNSGRFLAIFPNVMLSVLPNHVCLMILDPVSPGVTRETLMWLLPPGEPVAEEAFAMTRSFWVDVNNEDIDIVERGQRGLTTGNYTPGRLSPRFEEPLHRFHNMLADRFCAVTRTPEGDASSSLVRHL